MATPRQHALARIEAFNADLADLRLQAAKVLLEVARSHEDLAQRRLAAAAVLAARPAPYPPAAALHDDDTDDDDEPDDGDTPDPDNTPPPPDPQALQRAYAEGYSDGLKNRAAMGSFAPPSEHPSDQPPPAQPAASITHRPALTAHLFPCRPAIPRRPAPRRHLSSPPHTLPTTPTTPTTPQAARPASPDHPRPATASRPPHASPLHPS
jgi:hypothetical protein